VSRYHAELNRRCSPWCIVAMRWVLDNVDEIVRLRNRGFDWAASISPVPPACQLKAFLSLLKYSTPNISNSSLWSTTI